MNEIRPVHRGVAMRSNLEVQFARLFDAAGLKSEYEPAAFRTQGGNYLPDFLINEDWWVEIKPPQPRRSHIAQLDPARLATALDVRWCYFVQQQQAVLVVFFGFPYADQPADSIRIQPSPGERYGVDVVAGPLLSEPNWLEARQAVTEMGPVWQPPAL